MAISTRCLWNDGYDVICMPVVEAFFRDLLRTFTASRVSRDTNDKNQVPQICFDSFPAPLTQDPAVADRASMPIFMDGPERVHESDVNGGDPGGDKDGGESSTAGSRASNARTEDLMEKGAPAWNASWPGTFGAHSKNVGNELHMVRSKDDFYCSYSYNIEEDEK